MYRQIARNKRWSILLIALFCLAVVGLGVFCAWVFEAVWPFWALLAFCPLYVWWSLSHATRDAASSAGWSQAQAEQHERLLRVVETTAIRAGIPLPRVGVIDDPAPNAFAASLSPRNAVIGVTTGAVELTRFAEGLARALEKIEAHPARVSVASSEARRLFFVNDSGSGWWSQWLASHPPIAERLERLREVARGF